MKAPSKLKFFGVAGILAVAMFLLLTIAWFSPTSNPDGLRVGDAFPEVSLQDLDGKTVKLPGDASGKIVIIHFWAAWCPLCVREMAALESARVTHGEQGLLTYSINSGESAKAAKTYAEKTKATYPILVDSSMAVTRKCGVNSIPTTFICDRKGIIRFKILGEVDGTRLEQILATLFQQGV
ncbi:MAG: TlpA disulfide reductase family protein [Syntrophobacter sp.]